MTTQRQSGRGAPRFIVGLPAEVTLNGGKIACETADLSRSGVLVTGGFPPQLAGLVELSFGSIGGDLQVDLRARVARTEATTDGIRVGLEFWEVDSSRQPTLEALLARVKEGTGSGTLETITPTSKPDEIRAALAKMSVSHKVALARRGGAMERRYLRMDPSPLVIEALTRNPQVNLAEVIGIARINSLLPTTIEFLVNDPRWRGAEELMILLASHPQATLPQARRAAGRLNDRGMDKLLRRPNLRGMLREKLLNPAGRRQLRG